MRPRAVWRVARREVAGIVRASSSWVALALTSPAVGLAFLAARRSLRARPAWMVLEDVFALGALVGAVAALVLGARAFVDERLSGSLVTLSVAPIDDAEVAVGKWLSAVVVAVAIAAVGVAPWTLLVAGAASVPPDLLAHGASALVGTLLLAASAAGIGLAASAALRAPVAVLAMSASVGLALGLAGRAASHLDGGAGAVAEWLSAEAHTLAFTRGAPSISDLVYFVGLSYLTLTASVVILRRARWE